MVRAILDGRKTQTRRIMRHQPRFIESANIPHWRIDCDHMSVPFDPACESLLRSSLCHHFDGPAAPGGRLWVRESFVYRTKHDRYYYKADHEAPFTAPYAHSGWKPSIHMPRAASRLTLDVTAVRVERLQAISGDDAKAEGAPTFADDPLRGAGNMAALSWFRSLWDDINGNRASWESNPWVWVVEFKRAEVRK